MRFFTDGHAVIRLHTNAKMGEPEFDTAKAETWQFRSGVWAEKPHLVSKIRFTGDWAPCTEREATEKLHYPLDSAVPGAQAGGPTAESGRG